MTNNWTDIVLRYWRAEKVELNLGATKEAIESAEAELDFMFPEEFKELYLKVDGFNDWDWLPNMFSIWPIERILEEYKSDNKKEFICFADYLINSWKICFNKSNAAIFIVYDKIVEEKPKYITDNFFESINLINSNSDKIY